MRQQDCPNCGVSFDGEAAVDCPRCGESVAPARRVWRLCFFIGFFGTPAMCLALHLWAPAQAYVPARFQIPTMSLLSGQLVTVIAGSGVSAYFLARSERNPPYGGWMVVYWIALSLFYAMILVLDYL